jgi:plasmid maintenance system antidote protein VapI
MTPYFYTRKPVAKILGVTTRTVSRYIAEGSLRARRGPHGYVVTAGAVRDFLRRRGGTPLRAVLRVEGTRQRVLARQLGISEPEFSAIVRGRRVPDAELAARIASVCGVPMEQLFSDRDRGAA